MVRRLGRAHNTRQLGSGGPWFDQCHSHRTPALAGESGLIRLEACGDRGVQLLRVILVQPKELHFLAQPAVLVETEDDVHVLPPAALLRRRHASGAHSGGCAFELGLGRGLGLAAPSSQRGDCGALGANRLLELYHLVLLGAHEGGEHREAFVGGRPHRHPVRKKRAEHEDPDHCREGKLDCIALELARRRWRRRAQAAEHGGRVTIKAWCARRALHEALRWALLLAVRGLAARVEERRRAEGDGLHFQTGALRWYGGRTLFKLVVNCLPKHHEGQDSETWR